MAPRNRIGDMVQQSGALDELQLRAALARQEQWGGRLTMSLSEMGLESKTVEIISKATRLPRLQLDKLEKNQAVLDRIDVSMAEQRGVFPVELKDSGRILVLAMADPTDLETLDQVALRAKARILPGVAGEREIQNAILRLYRNTQPSEKGQEVPMTHRLTVLEESDEPTDHLFHDPLSASGPAPAEDSSVRDMLDDLLSAPQDALTDEDVQRVVDAKAHQEKCTRIFRALAELLMEKGVTTVQELRARVR